MTAGERTEDRRDATGEPREMGAVHSTLNAGLRLATLAIRGLVVLVFARYLPPNELGAFAILTAGISFALLAVGCDFYVYSSRQIPGAAPARVRSIVLNHGLFLLGSYAVVGPIAVLAALRSHELAAHLPWFVGLTVLEHLNQEISRIVQMLGEITLSSVLLFMRSALWVLILVPIFAWYPSARSLECVLLGWSVMSAATLAYAATWFGGRFGYAGYGGIDLSWIRKGGAVALMYLASTLLFRAIASFDRFVVEGIGGAESVAKYTLAVTVGMVIPNVVDPAVMMYAFTKQVQAFQAGDRERFNDVTIRSMRTVLLVATGLAIGALAAGSQIGRLLGNPAYEIPPSWLAVSVLGGVVYCLAQIPNYVLYAAGRDLDILRSNVVGFAVFVGSVWLARRTSDAFMVLVAVFASYAVLLTAKSLLAHRAWRNMTTTIEPTR